MSRTISLRHRYEDPATSADPRVRVLVDKLSDLDYAPAPRPEFRTELRAQLVAIAERVVAEGDVAAVADTTSVRALEQPAARSRRRVARPLGLAAACCAVLALGLGGAVWKSRSALPGDSLYGLKRASESVQLSLTSGDTDRGHEYLKLATTRVHEAQDLLSHDSALASGSGVQAGGLSPATVSLIRSALGSANSDVKDGSSLLGTQAVHSHSATPLAIMTGWAPSQLRALNQLATALPDGPAHTSTLQSWTLVHSALVRARTLRPQVGSQCTAVHTDDLGPTSCSSTTTRHAPRTPVTPTQHATPAQRHASTSPTKQNSPASHSTTGPTSSAGPATHHAKNPNNAQHPGRSASRTPPTLPTRPKLPSTLPSLPVSVSSCSVSAQVGPVGVHLGSCPSGS